MEVKGEIPRWAKHPQGQPPPQHKQLTTEPIEKAKSKYTPQPKVATGALASALMVIVVWVVGLLSYTLPPEVVAAMSTIVYFIISYIIPPSPSN